MNDQHHGSERLSRTRWNGLRAVIILWYANFVVPLLVLFDPIAAAMAAAFTLGVLCICGLRLHAGLFLNTKAAVWGEQRLGIGLLIVLCLGVLVVLCAVDAGLRPFGLPHAGQLLGVGLAFWLLQGLTGRVLERRHARRVAEASSAPQAGR